LSVILAEGEYTLRGKSSSKRSATHPERQSTAAKPVTQVDVSPLLISDIPTGSPFTKKRIKWNTEIRGKYKKLDRVPTFEELARLQRHTGVEVSVTPGKLNRTATKSKESADALQMAVLRRAIAVIGDEQEAMRWMGTPVRALNYSTPISLLYNPHGREAVLTVLGRLEHGVL